MLSLLSTLLIIEIDWLRKVDLNGEQIIDQVVGGHWVSFSSNKQPLAPYRNIMAYDH